MEVVREDLRIKPGPPNWHQAIVAGLAGVLCYWIAQAGGLKQGFWAVIIAVVVVQSEVRSTIAACRDQLAGAALGAFLGWITALIWHGHLLVFGVMLVIALIISNLIGFKNAGRLAGVTIVITVLIRLPEPPWRMALDRFVEVALGILVALAVSFIPYPAPKEKREAGSSLPSGPKGA